MKILFTFIVVVLLSSACGQKGDLVLPDDLPDESASEQEREGG